MPCAMVYYLTSDINTGQYKVLLLLQIDYGIHSSVTVFIFSLDLNKLEIPHSLTVMKDDDTLKEYLLVGLRNGTIFQYSIDPRSLTAPLTFQYE